MPQRLNSKMQKNCVLEVEQIFQSINQTSLICLFWRPRFLFLVAAAAAPAAAAAAAAAASAAAAAITVDVVEVQR